MTFRCQSRVYQYRLCFDYHSRYLFERIFSFVVFVPRTRIARGEKRKPSFIQLELFINVERHLNYCLLSLGASCELSYIQLSRVEVSWFVIERGPILRNNYPGTLQVHWPCFVESNVLGFRDNGRVLTWLRKLPSSLSPPHCLHSRICIARSSVNFILKSLRISALIDRDYRR